MIIWLLHEKYTSDFTVRVKIFLFQFSCTTAYIYNLWTCVVYWLLHSWALRCENVTCVCVCLNTLYSFLYNTLFLVPRFIGSLFGFLHFLSSLYIIINALLSANHVFNNVQWRLFYCGYEIPDTLHSFFLSFFWEFDNHKKLYAPNIFICYIHIFASFRCCSYTYINRNATFIMCCYCCWVSNTI